MKPVRFDGVNETYAKNQPEYIPLPVYRDSTPQGAVTSCWRLTWRERLRVLLLGDVWLTQLTFRQPLQPVRLQTVPYGTPMVERSVLRSMVARFTP